MNILLKFLARRLAQEQRDQDFEKCRQMSPRDLKESLSAAGVDVSTILEADELRRLMCRRMERQLFDRTRQNMSRQLQSRTRQSQR